jgi:hypothetical protein
MSRCPRSDRADDSGCGRLRLEGSGDGCRSRVGPRVVRPHARPPLWNRPDYRPTVRQSSGTGQGAESSVRPRGLYPRADDSQPDTIATDSAALTTFAVPAGGADAHAVARTDIARPSAMARSMARSLHLRSGGLWPSFVSPGRSPDVSRFDTTGRPPGGCGQRSGHPSSQPPQEDPRDLHRQTQEGVGAAPCSTDRSCRCETSAYSQLTGQSLPGKARARVL